MTSVIINYEQFYLVNVFICDIFRVSRGICEGALERFRSSYPSSVVMGVAQPRYSALFPPSMESIKTALVFPWNADVGVGGMFLPPPCFGEMPSFQLLGAAVTPSRVLPFTILDSMVSGVYPAPGNPLILRARYSSTVFASVFPSLLGTCF